VETLNVQYNQEQGESLIAILKSPQENSFGYSQETEVGTSKVLKATAPPPNLTSTMADISKQPDTPSLDDYIAQLTPSQAVENLNTQELCQMLHTCGISDGVVKVLEEEDISGADFLDLTQEDLEKMRLRIKMGQVKKLLRLQNQCRDHMPPLSPEVSFTREHHDERRRLVAVLKTLPNRIEESLDKVEKMQKVLRHVKENEADLTGKPVKDWKLPGYCLINIDLPDGHKATNCKICKTTCDPDCYMSYVKDCEAFWGTNCTRCKHKCSYEDHEWKTYRIESLLAMQMPTYTFVEHLQTQPYTTNTEQDKYESIMQFFQKQADRLDDEVQGVIHETHRCVHRLEEIDEKPNPISEVDYVRMLIEQEKKKESFSHRAATLQKALRQAQMKTQDSQMKMVFKSLHKKKAEWPTPAHNK
jgi:hypothetical protein